jgi:hypothetical protein
VLGGNRAGPRGIGPFRRGLAGHGIPNRPFVDHVALVEVPVHRLEELLALSCVQLGSERRSVVVHLVVLSYDRGVEVVDDEHGGLRCCYRESTLPPNLGNVHHYLRCTSRRFRDLFLLFTLEFGMDPGDVVSNPRVLVRDQIEGPVAERSTIRLIHVFEPTVVVEVPCTALHGDAGLVDPEPPGGTWIEPEGLGRDLVEVLVYELGHLFVDVLDEVDELEVLHGILLLS